MSAAYQYYHLLPSLEDLVSYIQQKCCSPDDPHCHLRAASLLSAVSLDIDFDAISHTVTLTAFWDHVDYGARGSETVSRLDPTDSVEVGVLGNEKPTEPEELTLSGFLTVLGEDKKPNPTLFSFPSRHQPLHPPQTFKTSFNQPTGLHPKLSLTFSRAALTPPNPSCHLHAYLTLPSALFVDKYQFSDPLSLSSHHLKALHALSGATDLEAPDWVIPTWGSAALFELAHPTGPSAQPAAHTAAAAAAAEAANWTSSIPLHLRYLAPKNASAEHGGGGEPGLRDLPVPWPAVFWACEPDEGLRMAVNPFDRVALGFDTLFGPKTMFYHLAPSRAGAGVGDGAAGEAVEGIRVPVLDVERAGWVGVGTAASVLVGFVWVCWCLLRGFDLRGWGWSGEAKRVRKKRE
ncbi:protease B nonderepressible form [Elasticomyces elasticus]|nr:protease B nonderepressible form [Elasticomyces elasticus]